MKPYQNLSQEIVLTSDGSHTLFVPSLNEHYHSWHGAVKESQHIYINSALKLKINSPVSILEMGFGTGLNAFLTCLEAERCKTPVHYVSIEKYPLQLQKIKKLNYSQLIDPLNADLYIQLHTVDWEEVVNVHPNFKFQKTNIDLLEFNTETTFDIIYFDAFAPDVQPELWTEEVFRKLYRLLNMDGVLITYSTKGLVKRNLKSCGFYIEKLKGPEGGKREILRAIKRV